MAGASGPDLEALGALSPWVVGPGDAVAAVFRPQEKGLPAAWRRPGAPGAGGGPEAALSRRLRGRLSPPRTGDPSAVAEKGGRCGEP